MFSYTPVGLLVKRLSTLTNMLTSLPVLPNFDAETHRASRRPPLAYFETTRPAVYGYNYEPRDSNFPRLMSDHLYRRKLWKVSFMAFILTVVAVRDPA